MTEQLRVAVVSTSYPATAEDPAGHFARADALGRSRAGARVDVFAPGDRLVADPGIVATPLGGRALFQWPGAAARAREKPRRLVHFPLVGARLERAMSRTSREHGPWDVVVAHFSIPSAWPWLPSLSRSTRLEIWCHGADVRLFAALPSPVRRFVSERFASRASDVRFAGDALREAFLEAVPDPKTRRELEAMSIVASPPIELDAPAAHHRDARTADGTRFDIPARYAVWIGRDVTTKRLDLAIETARAAEITLIVIGADRPTRPRLHALGPRGRTETLAWIANATVLLSTSIAEGAPTAIREARALGVPVLASPCGDLDKWAACDQGIVVAAGSELVPSLRRLFDDRSQPPLSP